MKKSALLVLPVIVVTGLILLTGTACDKKESKYVKDIQTIEGLTTIIDGLARRLDKAPNEVAFRNAIAVFLVELKTIKPDMREFERKYPNFRMKGGEKDAPKELKAPIKKFYTSLSRMRAILDGKRTKYGKSKGAVRAYKKLKEEFYYY